MLSDWKRKNKLMLISENKLKGLIAVGLILAIIPFIVLFFQSARKYKIPEYADQCINCSVVEVVGDERASGIYYVPQGTLVNRLLKSAGIAKRFKNDFELKNGMKMVVHPESGTMGIVVAEIRNAAKISIGMPIDINQASEEDLVLIKGIGPATAKRILDLRLKLKGIKDIKQLMEIKGIKEKRLRKIEKYLYVKD